MRVVVAPPAQRGGVRGGGLGRRVELGEYTGRWFRRKKGGKLHLLCRDVVHFNRLISYERWRKSRPNMYIIKSFRGKIGCNDPRFADCNSVQVTEAIAFSSFKLK